MSAPLARMALRNVSKPKMARFYNQQPAKRPTMNDLPVPEGSWQEQYNANQRRYNLHLAAGVLTMTGSISLAYGSGLLTLNYLPPDSLE